MGFANVHEEPKINDVEDNVYEEPMINNVEDNMYEESNINDVVQCKSSLGV
jgi:hypothetical protein